MGSCFSSSASSSSSDSVRTPTARVIALDGSLNEYSVSVSVSTVLKSTQSCFLCDSDSLYFDTCIFAMDSETLLVPGHIYFVLPVAKLNDPLSGSDMAALAVKASSAIARASEGWAGHRTIRIMSIEEECEGDGVNRFNEFSVAKDGKRGNERGLGVSRHCNRVRLSTIQEGDE